MEPNLRAKQQVFREILAVLVFILRRIWELFGDSGAIVTDSKEIYEKMKI